MTIAISGASGKTGYRIAEEAVKMHSKVKLLVRQRSRIISSLSKCDYSEVDLFNPKSLDKSLKGCSSLIIATGARPSIDLTGPLKIDAIGVKNQVESCKRVGLKRIILVSSLCTGKLLHPLNLFGLILICKRFGERSLEGSGLDWTIIRPGGLTEQEDNLDKQGIYYSEANQQEDSSIPRRLVAKTCIEAFKSNESIGKIIEVTSNEELEKTSFKKAISGFKMTVE